MTEKRFRTRDILGVEKTRRNLAALFEAIPAGAERRRIFLEELTAKLSRSALGEQAEGLKTALQNFSTAFFETEADFLEAVLQAVLDYMDKHLDPLEVERRLRERFVAKENFIPLSEILSFGYDNRTAHIHLAPAKTMGPKEMLASIRRGLRELARRLNEDPNLRGVEEVTATSALVAEHSSLMERLGLFYEGLVDEETRQRYFPDETRPVGRCRVSREGFLKQYLSQ